jgi:hypothetical protein
MRRSIALTGAVLLLGGLGIPAIAAARVVFGGDVAGVYRERPVHIHITSDQNITRIGWSSWGGKSATGRGTMVFSRADRTPSAAVRLRLSHIQGCGKRRQYLRLRVTYVSKKPARERRSYTVRYTCRSAS